MCTADRSCPESTAKDTACTIFAPKLKFYKIYYKNKKIYIKVQSDP
jgi:hypothetical protein